MKGAAMGAFKRQLTERHEPANPATLGDLMHEGLQVFCWCHRCGHNAELDTAPLIARLGLNWPISHLQPLRNPALLPARLSWRFVEFGFANEPHPWLEKPDFPKPLPQSRGRFEQFLERQEDG